MNLWTFSEWIAERLIEGSLIYNVFLDLKDRLVKNPVIRSDQPNSFYQLVLADINVPNGLGDKEYRRRIKWVADGNTMDALPPPPVHAASSHAGLEALEDEGFDAGGSNFEPLPPPPKAKAKAKSILPGAKVAPVPLSWNAPPKAAPKALAAPKAEPVPAPLAPATPLAKSPPPTPAGLAYLDEAVSSDSSSSSGFDAGGHSKISDWKRLPILHTPKFKLEYYQAEAHGKYQRWVCECSHHGAACQKKRSTAFIKKHGNVEPIAYLCSWNEAGKDLPADRHIQDWKPQAPLVASWAEKIGDKANKLLKLVEAKS